MTIATIRRELLDVPVGLIDAPALPSRSQMDDQKLDELTASLRAIGLQQPLTLARTGERFEVIAGHRRSIAAARAGLVTVPALVYPSRDAALEAAKFAENYYREDLNPADEAIWFSELLDRDCDGDVDKLCAQLHLKRSFVEGRLLLFQGDAEIFNALRAGKITIGVAHQLNRCKATNYRRMLLHQAIVGGATTSVVSGWIMDWENQDRAQGVTTAAPAVEPAPAPVPETNYFTCACCLGTDNVHLMKPINIHDHCFRAIVWPLLKSYRGEA